MNKAADTPRDYSLIAPIYDHVFNLPLSEGHRTIGDLIDGLKKKRGFKMLEVGVGSGLTLQYVPQQIQFVGIDINERMLARARSKAHKHSNKKISLEVMNAERLKFSDETFDLVVAPSVITAMGSPLQGVREMIRVTKKGGHLAIIANLRVENSLGSEMVRLMDPVMKKFLGFRTDLRLEDFNRFKSIRLVEKKQINCLMGFPLSWYLLFEKK